MKVGFFTKDLKMEPLGIMYLSAMLKKRGINTEMYDVSLAPMSTYRHGDIDVGACSVMTGDHEFYSNFTRAYKEEVRDIPFIAGGPHPTFFPSYLEHSYFDAICRGEGEEAIVEFVEGNDKIKIKNLWFKDGENIVSNPMRPLLRPLDTLPHPDRSLIDKYEGIGDSPIRHFIAGRGCPYKCTYCFNHAYFEIYKRNCGAQPKVRLRSVDDVIREIKTTTNEYETKLIYFQDDTFIIDKIWLKEFTKKYSLEVGYQYHCHIRADLIDKEIVSLLKHSGCSSVHMAVESGNEKLRRDVLKRKMTNEQILKASNLLKDAEIKIMMQNILGLPMGSWEIDLETLELNIACEPECAWASIFQPYPGTELARLSSELGLYEGNYSDLGSNFYEHSKLNFSKKYKDKMWKLHKLFGLIVDNPWLYESGTYEYLFDLDETTYNEIFKAYRKQADKKLYGFEL
jgi:radical SAM superfamily enzyme YgiQ (UPF0313 family)